MSQKHSIVQPEAVFFQDDGAIPNSSLPLLLYRQAFSPDTTFLASVIEKRFCENDWMGAWRAGVFPFHHYHSTTHEVLASVAALRPCISGANTAGRSK